MDLFKNPPLPRDRLYHVSFHRFLDETEEVLREMMNLLHVDLHDPYVKASLDRYLTEHKEYKKKRKYVNPSLSSLGLDKDEMDRKYAEYIEFFKL
jgi:hypothetical protein